MSEKVSAFLLGLLFGSPVFLLFFIALFVFAISLSVFRMNRKWHMLPIPILLSVSTVGLAAFIDSQVQRFAFMVLASVIYYFCLLGIYRLNFYEKDQTARSILASSSAVAIFFFYASLYGTYLNFTIPLWLVMGAFFLASSLVGFQYFKLLEKSRKKVLIYATVTGMAISEIAWVLSFWPFGYLTTGVVMLIFYYVLWDLVCMYFSESLSKKRVMTNMFFFGILVATVLASARWLPVV